MVVMVVDVVGVGVVGVVGVVLAVVDSVDQGLSTSQNDGDCVCHHEFFTTTKNCEKNENMTENCFDFSDTDTIKLIVDKYLKSDTTSKECVCAFLEDLSFVLTAQGNSANARHFSASLSNELCNAFGMILCYMDNEAIRFMDDFGFPLDKGATNTYERFCDFFVDKN